MSQKYFESQQSDEEVILLVRRHLIALFPVLSIGALIYFIGFLAVFVLPFVAPAIVSGFAFNIYVLIVSLLFLFNTIVIFHSWVLNYLHVAILTTEHFVEIEQASLFSRKISQMALDRIQDVSSSQNGLIDTMFNLGKIEIQTAGEAPNFAIEFASNPDAISQKIMETEEDYCQRKGIRTTVDLPTEASVPSSPTIEYPGA